MCVCVCVCVCVVNMRSYDVKLQDTRVSIKQYWVEVRHRTPDEGRHHYVFVVINMQICPNLDFFCVGMGTRARARARVCEVTDPKL